METQTTKEDVTTITSPVPTPVQSGGNRSTSKRTTPFRPSRPLPEPVAQLVQNAWPSAPVEAVDAWLRTTLVHKDDRPTCLTSEYCKHSDLTSLAGKNPAGNDMYNCVRCGEASRAFVDNKGLKGLAKHLWRGHLNAVLSDRGFWELAMEKNRKDWGPEVCAKIREGLDAIPHFTTQEPYQPAPKSGGENMNSLSKYRRSQEHNQDLVSLIELSMDNEWPLSVIQSHSFQRLLQLARKRRWLAQACDDLSAQSLLEALRTVHANVVQGRINRMHSVAQEILSDATRRHAAGESITPVLGKEFMLTANEWQAVDGQTFQCVVAHSIDSSWQRIRQLIRFVHTPVPLTTTTATLPDGTQRGVSASDQTIGSRFGAAVAEGMRSFGLDGSRVRALLTPAALSMPAAVHTLGTEPQQGMLDLITETITGVLSPQSTTLGGLWQMLGQAQALWTALSGSPELLALYKAEAFLTQSTAAAAAGSDANQSVEATVQDLLANEAEFSRCFTPPRVTMPVDGSLAETAFATAAVADGSLHQQTPIDLLSAALHAASNSHNSSHHAPPQSPHAAADMSAAAAAATLTSVAAQISQATGGSNSGALLAAATDTTTPPPPTNVTITQQQPGDAACHVVDRCLSLLHPEVERMTNAGHHTPRSKLSEAELIEQLQPSLQDGAVRLAALLSTVSWLRQSYNALKATVNGASARFPEAAGTVDAFKPWLDTVSIQELSQVHTVLTGLQFLVEQVQAEDPQYDSLWIALDAVVRGQYKPWTVLADDTSLTQQLKQELTTSLAGKLSQDHMKNLLVAIEQAALLSPASAWAILNPRISAAVLSDAAARTEGGTASNPDILRQVALEHATKELEAVMTAALQMHVNSSEQNRLITMSGTGGSVGVPGITSPAASSGAGSKRKSTVKLEGVVQRQRQWDELDNEQTASLPTQPAIAPGVTASATAAVHAEAEPLQMHVASKLHEECRAYLEAAWAYHEQSKVVEQGAAMLLPHQILQFWRNASQCTLLQGVARVVLGTPVAAITDATLAADIVSVVGNQQRLMSLTPLGRETLVFLAANGARASVGVTRSRLALGTAVSGTAGSAGRAVEVTTMPIGQPASHHDSNMTAHAPTSYVMSHTGVNGVDV